MVVIKTGVQILLQLSINKMYRQLDLQRKDLYLDQINWREKKKIQLSSVERS